MQAYRLILELFSNALSSSQKIQRTVCPVLAGANLGPGVTLTLVWCPHGQQMSDSDIIYCLFSTLHLIIRKKRNYLLIHTPNYPLVNCYAKKNCNNTLCRRHNVRTIFRRVPMPLVTKDSFSLFYHYHLADIRLFFFNQFVKFILIHNLHFLSTTIYSWIISLCQQRIVHHFVRNFL